MLRVDPAITLFPYLHGKALFAKELRDFCLKHRFDAVSIDIPSLFQPYLPQAIETLPEISALVATETDSTLYYLPIDPCDAAIEGIRQSFQHHIPFYATGFPFCTEPHPLPPMPDEYAITNMGFEAYCTLCLQIIGNLPPDPDDQLHGRSIAHHLTTLKQTYSSILAITHIRRIPEVVKLLTKKHSTIEFPSASTYRVISQHINPDHLYFALGELPFVTGKYEQERYDCFAAAFDPVTAIKDLFRETREMSTSTVTLSPVRVQAALTFVRNLTVLENRLIPSLFDLIEAAKGVGGNNYALQVLKGAKYYPWIAPERLRESLRIGIDKMRVPAWAISAPAVNLFRDQKVYWRQLELRPDPSEQQKLNYRYTWNPYGMCSHTPEDLAIESFNKRVRNKTRALIMDAHVTSEKFTASVKDGIDIRQTVRHWYTGDIYVKELPPVQGKVDTVIIIFDPDHDNRYPHCTTWYAEHDNESTLSFYATDPFGQLIGPGVGRCEYGGLSLLFPPRAVPDIFHSKTAQKLPDSCARLTYGALLYSNEKIIPFVSARSPDTFLTNLAATFKKKLLWIPLATFSHETIIKLRIFHILNGKHVRSWATRFIGD